MVQAGPTARKGKAPRDTLKPPPSLSSSPWVLTVSQGRATLEVLREVLPGPKSQIKPGNQVSEGSALGP